MCKRYKFIHFFLNNKSGFNQYVIDMINDEEFETDQHLFITSDYELYDRNANRCNMIFIDHEDNVKARAINKYGEFGDWIILHSVPSPQVAVHIKSKIRRKTIWRTWGRDISVPMHYVSIREIFVHFNWIIHGDIRYVLEDTFTKLRWPIVIRDFYAIGIANVIDEIRIRQIYDKTRFIRLDYHPGLECEKSVILNKGKTVKDGYYHVMVGHSACRIDNHCAMVDLLKKFENQNIVIHIILSNDGDEDYIRNVKEYIENNWNGKKEIIMAMMSYDEYVKYVDGMDAIILDGECSYALGNISIGVYYGKKFFLNRKGVIAEGMRMEDIPYNNIDEIPEMTWDEFIKPLEYEVDIKKSTLVGTTFLENKNNWKELFNELSMKSDNLWVKGD